MFWIGGLNESLLETGSIRSYLKPFKIQNMKNKTKKIILAFIASLFSYVIVCGQHTKVDTAKVHYVSLDDYLFKHHPTGRISFLLNKERTGMNILEWASDTTAFVLYDGGALSYYTIRRQKK